MVAMDLDGDDPQQLRIAYVDWRLARLGNDLENLDDSYASDLTSDIEKTRQHLSRDVVDGPVDPLDDARGKAAALGDADDRSAVGQLCRMVLDNCEAILQDYLDIRSVDFPADEDDYVSPEEFPAWDRFRDDSEAPRG